MNSALATPTLAGLGARLAAHGFAELDAAGFDAFAEAPGNVLVLFAEDPARVGETWDVAVVLPEVLKGLAAPSRTAFLLPEAARAIQPRFGFRTWPAVVLLRDGGYVGVLEGMRDWATYQREIAELLKAPVSRPPTLGVPVKNDTPASPCH